MEDDNLIVLVLDDTTTRAIAVNNTMINISSIHVVNRNLVGKNINRLLVPSKVIRLILADDNDL